MSELNYAEIRREYVRRLTLGVGLCFAYSFLEMLNCLKQNQLKNIRKRMAHSFSFYFVFIIFLMVGVS